MPGSPQVFCFHSNCMFYRSSRLKFASWPCLSLPAVRTPILMEAMWISLIKGRLKNKKAQERKAQIIIYLHKGQEKRRPDIKVLTVVLLSCFFYCSSLFLSQWIRKKMIHVVSQNNCASLCNYKVECRKANHRDLFGHCNGPGSG